MTWDVEYTDEFGKWWDVLSEEEQISVDASVRLLEKCGPVDASVRLLEKCGPALGFPHTSKISSSKHKHMRELRIQHQGSPFRVLYAFDPRRTAILLIGGDKTGDDRWYEKSIPMADRLYDEHLDELRKEGSIDGQ